MSEWREVVGYEGLYAVNRMGDVARVTTPQGRKIHRLCARRLKQGRVIYHLSRNGMARDVAGHRIVVEAFIGEIPPRMHVNHINGIPSDNRVENLEICTASENHLHAYRVLGKVSKGGGLPGERNGRSKFSNEERLQLKEMRFSGFSSKILTEMFDIRKSTIYKICGSPRKTRRQAGKQPTPSSRPNLPCV